MDFEANANAIGQRQDLDFLDKKCEAIQLCQAAYKARTENYYNRHMQVKNFKVWKWVLRKNESSRAQPWRKLSVT